MNQFIESLKRLYEQDKITKEKIIDMCVKGTISESDKEYNLERKE